MQQTKSEDIYQNLQSLRKLSIPFPFTMFDMEKVMEIQRQNISTLAEVNQCALKSWQALAQKQAKIVSEFMQDNSASSNSDFSAESFQNVCARSLKNASEIAEIVQNCASETADVINRRNAKEANR